MRFAIDETAALILLIGILIIGLCKRFLFQTPSQSPSLAFSRLNDLKQETWRTRLFPLSSKLHGIALLCFMIAFIDPHFLFPKSSSNSTKNHSSPELPTEGIAIYLTLDRSGSMAEKVEVTNEQGKSEFISKITLLKQVTKEFILQHPSDLIGLVTFARVPQVVVPLTLDQEFLLDQLNKIVVVKKGDEDGTAMGYAIYKTVKLLSATRHFANDGQQQGGLPYTIKSGVIILVTDGFQDPSRLDAGNRLRTLELDEAATYAKNEGIRLYIVNIDPHLSTAEYAPQRKQLQKITSLTGGQFYLVSNSFALKEVYADIDRIEKGTILHPTVEQTQDQKSLFHRYSLFPFFLFIGMLSLFVTLLLECTLLRRVP